MKRLWIAIALISLPFALLAPTRSEARTAAQPHVAAGSPSITLVPANGKPGETITVQGSGFACHSGNAVAIVTFQGTVENGSGTSINCNGTFSTAFRIPDVPIGTYTVTAKGYAASQQQQPTDTPTPVPTDTATPTATATATATDTATPTATATNTSTPTSTPTPTNTPTATPTATGIPTNTPMPTPTNTQQTPPVIVGFAPTATITPTPTETPTPTPTATPCLTYTQQNNYCGYGTGGLGSKPAAPAPKPADLSFDGDQASATITVTAPSAPFTVSQHKSCTTPPTAGVTATCTITETVTNNGGHALRFSGGVTNQLAGNVKATSVSSGHGATAIHGTTVTWKGFQLAPGQTVMAHIQVTFTPTAAQAGHRASLSRGITARATDLVTGQQYGTTYGTLTTLIRGNGPGVLPRTGYGGTAATRSAGVAGLPSTGGAASGS